jgi:hypothetical protein
LDSRPRCVTWRPKSTNGGSVLADWDTWFPGCEPVAHRLREAFPERWVRFHSLPGSKRYAADDGERAIVLDRHNRILDELALRDEEVALVTTGYSETPTPPIRSYPELSHLDPLARSWRTVVDDPDEPSFWHLFVSTRRWARGVFNPIVALVADDKLANVIIVALDGRWLVHPYDGGMDVITRSSEDRDALKMRHQEWLSARADGL